jgi:hypothetical protein
MGLIRLIIILIIIVGGYWAYYVFMANDPYDNIGVAINSHLPQQARAYGCAELFKRHSGVTAPPDGCDGLWGEKL